MVALDSNRKFYFDQDANTNIEIVKWRLGNLLWDDIYRFAEENRRRGCCDIPVDWSQSRVPTVAKLLSKIVISKRVPPQ